MKKELPKVYDPQQVESRIYENWMEGGCFKAEPDPSKEPFSIVMPPPNVTGQLHMVGPKESYGDGTGNITVSDTASLTGHALVQLTNCGMQCLSGNITVGSGATLTAIADDGYSGTGSESYGLKAGYVYSPHGQVSIEGTLVASSGDAGDHGWHGSREYGRGQGVGSGKRHL